MKIGAASSSEERRLADPQLIRLKCSQDSDIVNVDVTVYHRGYHGDLNETFFVGTPKPLAKKLVQNTWECLEKVTCL